MLKTITDFSDCQEALAPRAPDIFALGNSVYHGLGLREILPEAKVICLDDDNLLPLLSQGKALVFSLMAQGDRPPTVFRSSANLLSAAAVRDFIGKNSHQPWLYVPKVNRRAEIQAEAIGARLIGASSNLNQAFEDKISFTGKLSDWHMAVTPRTEMKISVENLTTAADDWGWPLVVQFSRGIAGAGTKFLENEKELIDLVKLNQGRPAVVAKFTKGKTITLNACVTHLGTVVGKPFWQITGEMILNRNRGGTGGNDYAVDLGLTPDQLSEISRLTRFIGNEMSQSGYRGLFGLDFIIGDKISVIEINARPTASISTITQLENQQGEIPLLGLHLLEFLEIPYTFDIEKLNQIKAHSDYRGSKVILRNTTDAPVVLDRDLAPGVYDWLENRLVFKRPGWRVTDIGTTSECLIWTAKAGRSINVNIEEAMICYRHSILDGQFRLSPEAKKMVVSLRDQIQT